MPAGYREFSLRAKKDAFLQHLLQQSGNGGGALTKFRIHKKVQNASFAFKPTLW